MAPIIERLDREAELNGTTADLPGTTLLQALKPRFGGETPKVDVDALVLVESENYKNISLLRGDIGLNAAEDDFSQAHVQRLSNQTHFKFSYVAMYVTSHCPRQSIMRTISSSTLARALGR